jgi:hypothetical protein
MTKKHSVYLASLFLLIAIGFWSCGPGDTPDQEATAEAASVPEPVVEPASDPVPVPPPEPAPTMEPMAEPSAAQYWDETVWVAGKEGKLVLGLDGGEYDPYSVTTVQQVQQALTSKGLYSGAISGVLDKATMEALAEFQKSNNLQACGVPTPRTREALLQP